MAQFKLVTHFCFRNSRAVELVIQKANWLIREAMKKDGTLIRVDLDFKNAFNSAGHSCLWTILEGFGVPDVWLLKSIYENSFMRVQVGGEYTAAIQLDTGTVQGSVLSPLLFDLFINALLRLLDSTGISHKVPTGTTRPSRMTSRSTQKKRQIRTSCSN